MFVTFAVTSYPQLNPGTQVEVCDSVKAADGSTWYYIRIAGKVYGFAHSDYIKKVSSGSVTDVKTETSKQYEHRLSSFFSSASADVFLVYPAMHRSADHMIRMPQKPIKGIRWRIPRRRPKKGRKGHQAKRQGHLKRM